MNCLNLKIMNICWTPYFYIIELLKKVPNVSNGTCEKGKKLKSNRFKYRIFIWHIFLYNWKWEYIYLRWKQGSIDYILKSYGFESVRWVEFKRVEAFKNIRWVALQSNQIYRLIMKCQSHDYSQYIHYIIARSLCACMWEQVFSEQTHCRLDLHRSAIIYIFTVICVRCVYVWIIYSHDPDKWHLLNHPNQAYKRELNSLPKFHFFLRCIFAWRNFWVLNTYIELISEQQQQQH